MESQSDKGIFINGKQQIIEMLQYMDDSDKQKLLKNISARNAVMGRELTEQSFSLKDLMRLNDHALSIVLRYSNAPIIGLALYLLPTDFQRRALSLMDRASAENAYHIMSQNLSSKKIECQRAQRKLLEAAIELSRRNQISFS
jgi:flagellar motor switch protein FliG